ncbi:g_PROTEIN_RECEP_F3_4 domain-containing protein [Trichonephila clavipes]|nr:g_PROTEIN_RECEP_F3_4 domain-containing protein [Trichonephila clavipes]
MEMELTGTADKEKCLEKYSGDGQCSLERNYFVPPLQHTSRLWRYNHHPATLQLPPPLHPSSEDIYLSSDRYLFGPPGMKLYRSPLY